jgi:NADH-quinone oxidoreductase subunit C
VSPADTLVDAVHASLGASLVAIDREAHPVTVDVAPERWVDALAAARDAGAAFFDLLSAYDLGDATFAVVCHVSTPDAAEHLLLRTTVGGAAPALASATSVYAGASWHERETHEMFGIDFVGHAYLVPLLLSPSAPAHPLRKDSVLAARAARPWPGEKDPADSGGRARRRRTLTPGVPEDWPAARPASRERAGGLPEDGVSAQGATP